MGVASNNVTITLVLLHHRKLVYSFTGWDSAVLTLVQSPALDVMGVGLGNGNVVLHNIRTDLSLMTFTQTTGPVTTIAFRTGAVTVCV